MEGGDIVKSDGKIGICCGNGYVILLSHNTEATSVGYKVNRIREDQLKDPISVQKWVYGMRHPESMIWKATEMIGQTTFGIDEQIKNIIYDNSCIIL